MKIGGKKVEAGLACELLVFPRPSGNIAFKAFAVLDRSEFDALVKPPKPGKKMTRGKNFVPDFESPKFIAESQAYSKKYLDWLAIASLKAATPDGGDEPIEWEKIDAHDPETWHLWTEELSDAGFSEMEKTRIINAVAAANSLSEARLDEARESFLAEAAAKAEQSSSATDAPNGTPSGELAKDSA